MKNLRSALVTGMVFLFTHSFGQTSELNTTKTQVKTAHTYLDLMINVVSTNINYGDANSALADYRQSNKGIQAGVSFQAGITPGLSIVSELYFIRKGGKLKSNNPLTTNQSTLHLNVLELPVLVRFHAGKLYVNAGPSLACNLSGKWKINDQSTKLLFNSSSDGFKRLDAGLQLGGGFEFPVKQNRVALDIRYVYGLTNITCGREMYNRAIMISVHFSKAWKTNPFGRKEKI